MTKIGKRRGERGSWLYVERERIIQSRSEEEQTEAPRNEGPNSGVVEVEAKSKNYPVAFLQKAEAG